MCRGVGTAGGGDEYQHIDAGATLNFVLLQVEIAGNRHPDGDRLPVDTRRSELPSHDRGESSQF
jgi:hypothetical protein